MSMKTNNQAPRSEKKLNRRAFVVIGIGIVIVGLILSEGLNFLVATLFGWS